MKKKSLLIFYYFFFISVAYAQITESPKNDFKNFLKCGGDLFSEPAHFDSKDFIALSSTLGLTAAVFLIDEDIQKIALENKGSFGDAIFKIDDYYHIEFAAASIAALYIYGTAAKNQSVRNLGLKLTEATVYSSTIMLISKFILGRERPANTNDALSFNLFNTQWEFTSLPSGHSTLSFAYSTVMASVYNNFLWKFGWYSLAALVGAARVYHNVHWFSDIILGAVIGYFVGDFVNNHYTNQKENAVSGSTHSTPDFSISFGFAF
ncbi:MAG: phosphatase PAP2 family protein [Ignavibacteriaceae bacterium]|nr:phosphatase PAP2 family protein [Ignavibacteriaceae bacterium]